MSQVAGEPIRLLLAEDEPFQALLLERLLVKAGYDVHTVPSGESALESVLADSFQILITDWDMPGMDGATLCRQIRAHSLPAYLYIILLTAHEDVSDTVKGLESGADDYLRKPANEAELLARLKTAVRIVGLERTLRAANERVHRLSVTDPLLGCFNRRYLNEQLPLEIERACRYGHPLCLVMTDLDNFKMINDVHGHMVGDDVLCGFVQRALASTRQASDWVARYGGEEFIIVLPQTNQQGGLSFAEKVRTDCSKMPYQTSAGPLVVTASFGVAQLESAPNPHNALLELLSRADAALYACKANGRNRVSCL
jgi:two-component system, cell cycle response regulator